MTDLQHWFEGAYGWLKGLGLVVAGGLFTELKYRRSKSRTRLGEAEDSGARWHLRGQREFTQSVQDERNALARELKEVREQLAELRERRAARDVQFRVIKAHVAMVTRMISERQPELANELHSSQFMRLLDDRGDV